MKIQNAINKLNKAGFKVNQNGIWFTAQKEGCLYVVEFRRNGNSEDATGISYRHDSDHSDSMRDYCASFFCDNLTRAIRGALA